jgi:hypothetical protein
METVRHGSNPGKAAALNYKPFSNAQYDADDDAKHLVAAYIAKEWAIQNVHVNPHQYGIDLLGDDNGQRIGIEVEVKHNWSGPNFPFSTVHFSARKTKFLAECPEVFFCMVNHERTHMIAVSSASFHESKLVHKNTKVSQGEWFIQLPLSRFDTYDLI